MISDAVKIALIVGIPPTITAVALGWKVLLEARKLKTQIGEVHVLVNSRLTELLKVTSSLAHEVGLKEGRASEKKKEAEGGESK